MLKYIKRQECWKRSKLQGEGSHEVSMQCAHTLNEVPQDYRGLLQQNTHCIGWISDSFPFRWDNFHTNFQIRFWQTDWCCSINAGVTAVFTKLMNLEGTWRGHTSAKAEQFAFFLFAQNLIGCSSTSSLYLPSFIKLCPLLRYPVNRWTNQWGWIGNFLDRSYQRKQSWWLTMKGPKANSAIFF